jgi:hypothetical protein
MTRDLDLKLVRILAEGLDGVEEAVVVVLEVLREGSVRLT